MKSRGSVMLLVLVFGGIFFILLASLASFVIGENRAQNALRARVEAFSIAEAGLTYYQWFLSHFPTDFTNGTGQPGPYVFTYKNPDGATVGTYSLAIIGSSACGSTQIVDITSTGTPSSYPSVSSVITGRYTTPSVATYATIVDNGSTPGVTFSSLVSDFASLKTIAQSQGIFIERHEVPQSPHLGFHLIFNVNGTVTINKVLDVNTMNNVKPADASRNSINDYTLILAEEPYQTVPVPSTCGLIFIEDNVWVEGTILGKVTLVVANLTGSGSSPDVVLRGNTAYATNDGSSGLTVIGEHHILIGPDSPTDMVLNGIFVAAKGVFGRNNYYYPGGGCTGEYESRGSLTINGTVVSKLTPRTKWPGGCGASDAGYQTQSITVDSQNAANPPPFTPTISSTRKFIDWQQIK